MSADGIIGHKVVLLGETSVGKSCLAVRFVKDEFMRQEATVAGECLHACAVVDHALHVCCVTAAYLSKTVNYDGKLVKYDIWDTSGQGSGLACACALFSHVTLPTFAAQSASEASRRCTIVKPK
jgi:hypothetical protein